jgi:hypothetical protein
MMSEQPEMPADPFLPPEEMVAIMTGLNQVRQAGVTAGMTEKAASEFIADVFVRLMANVQVANPGV